MLLLLLPLLLLLQLLPLLLRRRRPLAVVVVAADLHDVIGYHPLRLGNVEDLLVYPHQERHRSLYECRGRSRRVSNLSCWVCGRAQHHHHHVMTRQPDAS